MFLPVSVKQFSKLLVGNDAVDFGKVKDVGNVIRLQPVICRHDDTARRHDAVDGLKKSRGIRGKDTNSLIPVLLEIVG